MLAEFTNTTGDPVFDDTLRQGLAAQLQQSPFLSLVSDDRIGKTLAMMQQSPDARLTPEIAQAVCVRTASAAVLDGSIASLGSQYILALRAKNCATGDILADEQAQVARKEDVLGSLSQMATQVRQKLGESVATIEKYSRPLEATTASLDAWKAFTAARQVYLSSGRARAKPLFERAIAIDPDFAIAHAQLGIYYSAEGESALSRQSTVKAYQLRHRASDAERFYIETLYDRQVTGNMDREMETLEAWAQTYPRDPTPHGLLAGFATRSTGKYEQSIAAAERSEAIDPEGGSALSRASKAFSELYLNRLDAAEATIRRAEERKLANRIFPDSLLHRVLAGRWRRHAAAGRDGQSQSLHGRLDLASGGARPGSLRPAAGREADSRDRRRHPEAVWQAANGPPCSKRPPRCGKRFTGIRRQPGRRPPRPSRSAGAREVDYAAAFALAVSGDVSRSRALADDLARDHPEDTSVQFMYLPTLRALFALDARDPAAAIQSLQTASRFDLAMGGIGFNRYFRQALSDLRSRPGVSGGAAAGRGRRRVPADCRPSQHRARRSHRRVGAPAAGTSARALGRHREGEERLRRSLDALEECRPRHSGSQGRTGGIRATAVSGAFLYGVGPSRVGICQRFRCDLPPPNCRRYTLATIGACVVNAAALFLTNSCTLSGRCPVSISTSSDILSNRPARCRSAIAARWLTT